MNHEGKPREPGEGGHLAPERRCAATTADGRPCPARPMTGFDFCYQHNPDAKITEHRALSRRLGGMNATLQRFLPPETPRPSLANAQGVRELLTETIQQVRTGALPPNVGNTVIYGVMVGLRLAELELSARVAALEKQLVEREGRR